MPLNDAGTKPHQSRASMRTLATGAYTDAGLHIRGAASGPLMGRTFAVKDLFDVGHQYLSAWCPTNCEVSPANSSEKTAACISPPSGVPHMVFLACGAAADFRAPYWFWKSNMARDAQTRRQDGARCTVAARRWGNHPVRLHFPPSGPRNHNWCWSSSYRKRIAAPMLSARAPPPPHPQRQDPDG